MQFQSRVMSVSSSWPSFTLNQLMKALVYIYDLEIYNNLFLVGYRCVDKDATHFLRIGMGRNDLDRICELFMTMQMPEESDELVAPWFVGYNNFHFDNPVVNFVLRRRKKFSRMKILTICQKIHELGQQTIKGDKRYKYSVPFKSFDMMRILRLSVLRKSLKMVGINLKWPKIQEIPIDIHRNVESYELIEVMKYCENDVGMTTELYHKHREAINMRAAISVAYKVNVMNEDKSGIANVLTTKLYSEKMGIPPMYFRDGKTERGVMPMKSIIHSGISFKTKSMQKFLTDIKQQNLVKDKPLKFRVRIGDSVYDIAKGGLHSANKPMLVIKEKGFTIREGDVSSYYPRIMFEYGIKPKHLDKAFIVLLREITARRLKAKDAGYKIIAEALKITVNSIFGKMGYAGFWLYDLLAMYRVTVNGQLMLLMLIEELEVAGIPVFYANTDGIMAKVPDDKTQLYYDICVRWAKQTRMVLDFSEFDLCIIRDVNNYIVRKENGEVKMRGELDTERWKDVTKAFDKPVIPLAIRNYFLDKVPYEKTIREHDDILDFCMAQKPDRSFTVVFDQLDPKTNTIVRKVLQKANRYYISSEGGSIRKIKKGKEIAMVANQTVVIVNNFNPKTKYPDPKYDWYITQARKIIYLFEQTQGGLFS